MQPTIKRPWGVSAFGAASVAAVPDLARIRMTVDVTEPTPAKAFALARRGASQLRSTLRRHGVEDRAVSSSRLNLTSLFDYGRDRKFLGYQCRASFSVKISALDSLEEILVDAVAAGANRVDGVHFDVRDKPALRAEARRKAVAAARAKAELYADAAGVRLGTVAHIEDVDPESLDAGRYRGHASADEEPGEAELAPGMVVVSAAVVLGFTLLGG